LEHDSCFFLFGGEDDACVKIETFGPESYVSRLSCSL